MAVGPAPVEHWAAGSGRRTTASMVNVAVQADPGLDLPEDPHPRSSRPLDLADPRRVHPTTSGPPAGGRPATAVGKTEPARQAHSRPSPPRFPAPPPEGGLSCQSTEILPPRPRTAIRSQEHLAHTTLRRAHSRQTGPRKTTDEEVNNPASAPHRLKIKLGPVQIGEPGMGLCVPVEETSGHGHRVDQRVQREGLHGGRP